MMKKMIAGLGTVAVVGTLAGSVHLGVQLTVDYAVKIDAEHEAVNWAKYFITDMPKFTALLESGRPTDPQYALVKTAENIGNVFRFKLFNRKGLMVLVSDEARFRTEGSTSVHSEKALRVISTGISNVSLNDGTNKKNRPPLYVEAYVPVVEKTGEIVGVVEVYIDQTATANLIRGAFTILGIGLTAAFCLAFGLPALAYLARTRQEKRAREKVDYLASYDPMTDLMNRASFADALAIRQAVDDTDWRDAVFIYVDVDNFKQINDTHGHNVGDAYLKHIALCMVQKKLGHDLVARLGGDEFVMVAFGRTSESVVELVKAIRASAANPINVDGSTIVGTISVGFYWECNCQASLDTRMQRADMALYQAKLDGRNIYRQFSEEVEARICERRAIEKAIRTGLEEQRFDIHFQPLIQASSGRCVGFEALLRLTDDLGCSIPPVEFIPVAESIGAITEIGRWVLRRAVEAASDWPDYLFVSVNLSAKQFEDGTLVQTVRELLDQYGLLPNRLELEITESMLMANTEIIYPQIAELRELGASIAMDDFGTGYSSLSYLWKFKFDKLKIDRSFISALDIESEKASEILDTVVMLGHNLDMSVTAEGIESEAQVKVLQKLSCDHFQGYLFGKPIPQIEVAPYLLTNFQNTSSDSDESTAKSGTG